MIKKFIIFCVVSTVVVFVGLVVFRNQVVSFAIEKGAEKILGLDLDIGSLDIGARQPTIEVRDVVLHNPKGFDDSVMVNVPEVYIAYDLTGLRRGDIAFDEIRLNLSEFVVIRNKDGELNLDSLKAVAKENQGAQVLKDDKEVATDKQPVVNIKSVQLKLGKVIFKDYTSNPVTVKEYAINLNRRYENINNFNAVSKLIVTEVLTRTALSDIANVDLNQLQKSIVGNIKSVPEGATQVIGNTTDTIKKTATDLKGLLKSSLP